MAKWPERAHASEPSVLKTITNYTCTNRAQSTPIFEDVTSHVSRLIEQLASPGHISKWLGIDRSPRDDGPFTVWTPTHVVVGTFDAQKEKLPSPPLAESAVILVWARWDVRALILALQDPVPPLLLAAPAAIPPDPFAALVEGEVPPRLAPHLSVEFAAMQERSVARIKLSRGITVQRLICGSSSPQLGRKTLRCHRSLDSELHGTPRGRVACPARAASVSVILHVQRARLGGVLLALVVLTEIGHAIRLGDRQ